MIKNQTTYSEHFLKINLPQLIFGLIALCYAIITGEFIWLIATAIFYFLSFVMGESIFLHRYFSHKTFETHPLIAKFFAYMAVLGGFGGPIAYRCAHTGVHHAHTDKPGLDNHTPRDGFWHAWILWGCKPFKVPLMISKSLLKDKFYVFLESHSVKLWWGTFIVLALIDFRLALFTMGLSGFITTFIVTGLTTCYGHLHGSRRFDTDDNSRNNWWLSWITWSGSGALHNNHHAHPARYHDSWAWYEFDPAKYIIPLIATKINFNVDKN